MSQKAVWVVLYHALFVPLRLATCTLNFITGGSFYEPVCSRVWRHWAYDTYPRAFWRTLYVLLDSALFLDPEHCYKQFVKTKKRRVVGRWNVSWLWTTF